MGNLQGSESKIPKTTKSPGKGNRLMKRRFTRGKKDKDDFLGIVPDDEDTSTIIAAEDQSQIPKSTSSTTVKSSSLHQQSNKNIIESSGGSGEWSLLQTASSPTITAPPLVPASTTTQQKDIKEQQARTPETGESSTDSVFTDPLTPVGFAAEINQCYYSEESVLEADLPDTTSTTNVINSFKLNEYKIRRENELNKKLHKLGISKTSQISLEGNLDGECFVSEDVVILTDKNSDMPKNGNTSQDYSECALETTNESGVSSMDDTQEIITQSTRRSSYYRPRKIEIVATRLAPVDLNLNAGKLHFSISFSVYCTHVYKHYLDLYLLCVIRNFR